MTAMLYAALRTIYELRILPEFPYPQATLSTLRECAARTIHN